MKITNLQKKLFYSCNRFNFFVYINNFDSIEYNNTEDKEKNLKQEIKTMQNNINIYKNIEKIKSQEIIQDINFTLNTLKFIAYELKNVYLQYPEDKVFFQSLLEKTYMEPEKLADEVELMFQKVTKKLDNLILEYAKKYIDKDIINFDEINSNIRNEIMNFLLIEYCNTNIFRLEKFSKSFLKLSSNQDANKLFHALRNYRILCRTFNRSLEKIGVFYDDIDFLNDKIDYEKSELFNPIYFQNAKLEKIVKEVLQENQFSKDSFIIDISLWGLSTNFSQILKWDTKGYSSLGRDY